MDASRLDDRSFLKSFDPGGMWEMAEGFADQCRTAHELTNGAGLPSSAATPDNVVLAGMGGSAAGGDFVRALFDHEAKVPFIVSRDYTLPAWVNNGTLFFATSYSGNTEETLASYNEAKRRGASIICVTSGGKLAEWAKADGFPLVTIPAGLPPRMALGYLLVPVLVACDRLALIQPIDWEGIYRTLEQVVKEHGINTPLTKNPSKNLAVALHNRIPVIYGLGGWQGLVASRWKGQINENAKRMCFWHSQPELCHNELMGWEGAEHQTDRWSTIVLHDDRASAKMETRAKMVDKMTEGKSSHHWVEAPGNTLIERIIGLTFIGDWVSLYMSALNEVDPMSIDSINIMKAELAKIPD
ncbi:MAG: bifunctional phosphoglucose/phosphomannose isomerase [Fimbriimonadaceae bacterium]|nr:bifunctional phosphoglucose/phosphomannose isomerase [Fimbriimonadaceae bacterium]